MRSVLVTLMVAVLAVPASSAAGASQDALERARAQRQELERRVGDVVGKLEALAIRIDEAESLRANLEADVASLRDRARHANAALAVRAVQAFKHGQAGPFESLLSAEGPMEAVSRSRILAGVGRAEREAIERAAAARVAMIQKRAQLDALVAELSADRARLGSLQAELNQAFADARAKEGELASRRSRQRQVSRTNQRGVYACPLGRPFHFRDTWGARRSGGRRHKGVDMFAPMGAPVYAMTSGVIQRHSSSRLGGLGLYLRGHDGNVYYYAHLRRIAPGYGPGRRVEAGELIGYNGDSGNARGGAPHVHFEVHPGGGRAVNPYPFTAAACF